MKMDSCYAVNVIRRNDKWLCLAAPDDHGAAKAITMDDNMETCTSNTTDAEEIIWKEPSGTMAFIPLENAGEFIAIQNFFPTFDSKHTVLVKGQYINEVGWVIRPFLHVPYIHRVDVLHKDGINYLIICTLCSGKKSIDDWANPGKVLVGILPDDVNEEIELKCILEQQVKNHGYFKLKNEGYVLVASEDGVFEIKPPASPAGEWKVNRLLQLAAGDIAACDIDRDGFMEYFVITPFHGANYSIYKKIENKMELIWQYNTNVKFGHVAWAGKILGNPAFICGCREAGAALLCVTYDEKCEDKFKVTYIDGGQGPANICVLNEDGKDIVIATNTISGEVVAYEITDDNQ